MLQPPLTLEPSCSCRLAPITIVCRTAPHACNCNCAAGAHAGVAHRAYLALRGYAIRPDASTEETHDDFKPKYKGEPAEGDIAGQIKKDVTSNDVFIFMKASGTELAERVDAECLLGLGSGG